jgi:6-phosphofructokinase 1
MLKGSVIVGQSGGPTSVINSSLAGIVESAADVGDITAVLGMRWGIEGFLTGDIVDLSAEDDRTIEALRRTPSSALGSARYKVQDDDMPIIIDRLREFDVRALLMIGGNDTMDTVHRVTEYAASQGYELCGIGIPKTVDNDLYGTHHTPGFPSAARYVALSVQQSGLLARDMQKVDQFVIYQCIGRDAGWLSCAAALAKRDESDAPHLIYMPERPFDPEKFLADVKQVHSRYGFVSIVCGEGIKYADGSAVSASQTLDKFANVEYGAMGGTSVAVRLHKMIGDEFGWRGEFQITESLPMCAIDRAVQLDLDEAYLCGREAVELAAQGKSGVMVSLVRQSGEGYRCGMGTAPLAEVAVRAKPVPDEFINEEGNFPSEMMLDYLRPLIGELGDFARLKYQKAIKRE